MPGIVLFSYKLSIYKKVISFVITDHRSQILKLCRPRSKEINVVIKLDFIDLIA